MAQIVTLVNRTSKTLEGTWDGRHYPIAPGKHAFADYLAQKFKDQNPLMGSEDQYSLSTESLLGIEEYNDDCSPIEQSPVIERFDRNRIPGAAAKVSIVPGINGLYAAERSAPLPTDGGFVKP